MTIVSRNIGSVERGVRALLGIGILSLAFMGPQTPWAYLGLIPLFTAATGWCPLYSVLGISTCRNAPQ